MNEKNIKTSQITLCMTHLAGILTIIMLFLALLYGFAADGSYRNIAFREKIASSMKDRYMLV